MGTRDERLELLRRQWQATRLLEDEVAWLAERLRCGEVTRDQVGLAAYLGSEVAQSHWDPGEPPSDDQSVVLNVETSVDFSAMSTRERAIVVLHFDWSGQAVQARLRFERLARLLGHLAPEAGIGCYRISPEEIAEGERGQIWDWVAPIQRGGSGEIVWARGGARAEAPTVLSVHLSMHLTDQAFVKEAVTQFGLGL